MSLAKYIIQSRPNFPYTSTCLEQEIESLPQLLIHLQQLPYQRISNPEFPLLVLEESRGTCSSKHAFIKMLAEEQEWPTVKLLLVMYKMQEDNTPGVGKVLDQNGLEFIPEAHTVVEIDGVVHDITFPDSDFTELAADVLELKAIEGSQVGAWKKAYHRDWLKAWRGIKEVKMTVEELWTIREQCIAALSN